MKPGGVGVSIAVLEMLIWIDVRHEHRCSIRHCDPLHVLRAGVKHVSSAERVSSIEQVAGVQRSVVTHVGHLGAWSVFARLQGQPTHIGVGEVPGSQLLKSIVLEWCGQIVLDSRGDGLLEPCLNAVLNGSSTLAKPSI